nr:hypothetical protein [uncultured Oscillibacter sp.]
MTDLMEYLYDYTLSSRFPCYLHTAAYRDTDLPLTRHLDTLRRELPADLRQTFDKYREADGERHDLELEAMFQATWAVARALF